MRTVLVPKIIESLKYLQINTSTGLETQIHDVTMICYIYVCRPYIALRRFLHIEAISRPKEARSQDYALLLFRLTSRLFIVHSTIDSTVHSMPLNSLRHCICKATLTNIRPDRDSSWYLQVTSPSRYKWAIGAGHDDLFCDSNIILVSTVICKSQKDHCKVNCHQHN